VVFCLLMKSTISWAAESSLLVVGCAHVTARTVVKIKRRSFWKEDYFFKRSRIPTISRQQ
jgi:hypothetical protein